ncbi:MAG: hypothetical protein WB992_02460 [Bryobacteraceae bacterium]
MTELLLLHGISIIARSQASLTVVNVHTRGCLALFIHAGLSNGHRVDVEHQQIGLIPAPLT